jgi:hypothetical protein
MRRVRETVIRVALSVGTIAAVVFLVEAGTKWR